VVPVSDEDPDRVDMLEKRMDAMSKRCERQQDQIEHLRKRVAELESRTHPDAMDYERMDKADKVERVATYLYRKARDADAHTYAITYKEVVAVFHGKMSDGGTYSIMSTLGQRAGFAYATGNDGPNQLKCRPADVNEDAILSGLKKDTTENPA
jgi:hypothetical protein